MEYISDTDLMLFSEAVENGRSQLDSVPFFTDSSPTERGDEFEVLRRWNSHTPMLYGELGGGYLLRWNRRGIVLDPGCTFLDVFRRDHPNVYVERHCMSDISMVVATHDHIDHCEELSTLITLLRSLDEWKKREREITGNEHPPTRVDLILSHGVYFKCQTILEHPENRRLLRTCKVLPMRGVCSKRDEIDVVREYGLCIKCLRTRHREVLGDDTGFGLRMTLLQNGKRQFVLCDTGDTKYSRFLAEQYEGADLLILHLGTLEQLPQQSSGRKEHLCFGGVVRVLRQLRKPPKLVLLAEWGLEFRVPGYRTRFTEFVRRYCGNDTPILPTDIGMRVRIPDCHVWCYNAGVGGGFVPPNQVKVEDFGTWLRYTV
jgi:ribonuclease BN (tRNA processing enzyme)